jgi:hypothetical protein
MCRAAGRHDSWLTAAHNGIFCGHAGGGGDFEGISDTSSSMVDSNLTLSWVDILPPSSQADQVISLSALNLPAVQPRGLR